MGLRDRAPFRDVVNAASEHPIQVCMDAPLREWCAEQARREGRSVSGFVRRLLQLERERREAADG